MTYRCARCDVNWFPYMTLKGTCPMCGGGTVRTMAGSSPNAMTLHRELRRQGRSADAHERFETYYADRERKALAELEALAKLPTLDPPTP